MKTVPRKIHDIGSKGEWTNAHAVLGRAMEGMSPTTKMMVAWYDEGTKEIKYLNTATYLEMHYMCHRIAGAL